MAGDGLNAREAAFVREYLVDLNATRAAVRAGYSERGAAVTGLRLLRRAKVAAAISEASKARAERTELKADDVIRELMLVAFADLGLAFDAAGKMLPLTQMPPGVRRTLASIEVDEMDLGTRDDEGNPVPLGMTRKVKLWDKLRALELLGKHLQLFLDRTELSGEVKVSDVDDVRGAILARLAALRVARGGGGSPGGAGA